jgi:sodium/bile acid cotransporter 7
MKGNSRHLTRYAFRAANFVAAITLLITSSALPVKSDAFAIINDIAYHDTRAVMKPNVAIGRPRPSIIHLRENKHYSPLNLEVARDSECDVVKFRGGGDGLASSSLINKVGAYVSKNFFLLGMIVAVSFAKAFPNLGKNGSIVRPELFIGKYGVTTIFLISGISLKLQELTNAVSNVKLNGLIQLITFGAWPYLVGLPMTKGIELAFPGLLPAPLIEGLLILCCLPTTINMCIILTSAAGGSGEYLFICILLSELINQLCKPVLPSVATALCNTVISNLAGIFITPALLLRFFGKSIELPFVDLVRKLCSKVLFPVAVGQALRATPVKEFYSKHTGFFKRFQEVSLAVNFIWQVFCITHGFNAPQVVLLGIVWNAFSNAFSSGLGLEGKHAVALLTLLPTLHVASLASLFSFFRWKTFGFSMEEAIAATFCAAHKTLAFGLPLINTIFDGNPNLGES